MERSIKDRFKAVRGTFDEVWGPDEYVDKTVNKLLGDDESISEMATPYLWSPDELIERKLIYAGMAQQRVLNSFRELRIKLSQKTKSTNNIVLVSSPKNGAGSSFVAINLAAAFALDEHKTALYIDCNPKSSAADRYTVDPIQYGISDYLKDPSLSVEKIIHPAGLERLRVIASGSFHDSMAEDFNSSRMERLMTELRQRYRDRFIVIDAPSVQDSTEARILAKYSDLALLVVRFGTTTEAEVESAINAVGEKRFAGVVFND